MLDIYDRVGMVVMDENRDFGDSPEYVLNMGAMVKRDRNHPSVTIWSYCNEGGCGGGPTTGSGFYNITYAYDGTRPTLGNHVGNTDLNKYMDVQGFSHKGSGSFESYHKQFPKKPLFASECCSCETMRGEDVSVKAKTTGPGTLQSFNADCVAAQTQGSNALPFVSGTMVWTLFDYYGESHGWPHVISMFGQLDVAGFPKAPAYWYGYGLCGSVA
jgi:beta-galactosidase/beta-glucuronidase